MLLACGHSTRPQDRPTQAEDQTRKNARGRCMTALGQRCLVSGVAFK